MNSQVSFFLRRINALNKVEQNGSSWNLYDKTLGFINSGYPTVKEKQQIKPKTSANMLHQPPLSTQFTIWIYSLNFFL